MKVWHTANLHTLCGIIKYIHFGTEDGSGIYIPEMLSLKSDFRNLKTFCNVTLETLKEAIFQIHEFYKICYNCLLRHHRCVISFLACIILMPSFVFLCILYLVAFMTTALWWFRMHCGYTWKT